jgi:hypothetical protein
MKIVESLENEDGDKKEIEKQKSPYKKVPQWGSRFPSMKCKWRLYKLYEIIIFINIRRCYL